MRSAADSSPSHTVDTAVEDEDDLDIGLPSPGQLVDEYVLSYIDRSKD